MENPYATNAYASSRGTGGTVSGDIGGAGTDMGMAMPMAMPSKSKSAGNVKAKLNDTIKNTMAAAKQDNWKVVIVKATNHDLAAPKGKHVRVIMQGLQWGGSLTNRESPAGGIYYHLRKRMMLNQSVVCLKSLTIFHHIFRDGNEKFVDYVAANQRSIFRMDFFGDPSPEAMMYAPFIRTYGAYIEQWCAMRAAVRFPSGKSKDGDSTITSRYRAAAVEELLAALPVLMDSLNALFAIDMGGQIRFSPVATPAFSMIFRDLTILWVALSEGMIRLLDLFFELEQDKARIALDVYKRFVDLAGQARPFFETARSINARWQVPKLGEISLDLLDSMQKYVENGPQQPEFSDEEQYDDEPPEPEPEPYYEPEPEYYSEEEPEPEPIRMPTPPPVESSSESEEVEESDTETESESSSEEEPEVLPSVPEIAPTPPPPPKPFDPLADLLGIHSGVGDSSHQNGTGMYASTNPQNTMALQVYGAAGPAMFQRAGLDQTADERIANVKGMMHATTGQPNQHKGFGVDGSNMAVALYGHPQPQNMQQMQQQMYNSMAMQQQHQQQQQMAAYQTMAAYQSMAGYNPQQMAMLQQQQQQQMMHHQQQQQQQMMRHQQMMGGRGGLMQGGGGMRPSNSVGVPAMQAEKTAVQPANYKVQRGTKPTRVNADDQAFGPLLDQMKKASIGK